MIITKGIIEMIRLSALGFAIVVVGGCASMNAPDPAIPSNVKLTSPGPYGQQYIDSVRFQSLGEQKRSPARCVAEFVDNKSVTLTDSSSSFVGQYSGNYYNIGNTTKSEGGEVVRYADDREVVAAGRASYSVTHLGIPSAHVVEYKLTVEVGEGDVALKFSDVKGAMLSTGVAANDGFNPIGAWKAAGAVDAYGALESVAGKVMACVLGE